MSDAYLDALLAGAQASGVTLDRAVGEQMSRHHALVAKWAKKINLTTVTDPIRAASVHGVDSLLFGLPIPADDEGLTVDVGSGAGFPGIVVALLRPKTKMILLEPIRKRASFLRTALADLGLTTVRVVEGKLGEDSAVPWPVDRIISRATIPPLELVSLAAPCLAAGGTLIVSGGAGAPDEEKLAAVAKAVGLALRQRQRHTLPTGESRVIDVLEKVGPDPVER